MSIQLDHVSEVPLCAPPAMRPSMQPPTLGTGVVSPLLPQALSSPVQAKGLLEAEADQLRAKLRAAYTENEKAVRDERSHYEALLATARHESVEKSELTAQITNLREAQPYPEQRLPGPNPNPNLNPGNTSLTVTLSLFQESLCSARPVATVPVKKSFFETQSSASGNGCDKQCFRQWL